MKLFLYEAAYKRVDVARWAAYAVVLGVDAAWAYSAAVSVGHFALRALVGGGAIILIRLMLSRFGTSRMSSSLGAVTAFLLLGNLGLEQLILVGVFAAYTIVLVEFSKVPSKQLAVLTGAVSGLMAGVLSDYGHVVALLLGSFLIARTLWQLLFEHGSKLQLILFMAKAFACIVLAGLVYWLIGLYGHDLVDNVALAPMPTLPLWLMIVGGVLALRGVWSIVLLPTQRSPIARRQRILMAFIGLGIGISTWLCIHFGQRIFAAGSLSFLGEAGLLAWSVQVQIFGLLALLLFATSGIDRSLFMTSRFSEWLVPSKRR